MKIIRLLTKDNNGVLLILKLQTKFSILQTHADIDYSPLKQNEKIKIENDVKVSGL